MGAVELCPCLLQLCLEGGDELLQPSDVVREGVVVVGTAPATGGGTFAVGGAALRGWQREGTTADDTLLDELVDDDAHGLVLGLGECLEGIVGGVADANLCGCGRVVLQGDSTVPCAHSCCGCCGPCAMPWSMVVSRRSPCCRVTCTAA